METIKLIAYNIWGQIIKTGEIKFDRKNNIIIFPSDTCYNVVKCSGDVFRIENRTIYAIGGLNGFVEFLNEINIETSPFNPSRVEYFLDL